MNRILYIPFLSFLIFTLSCTSPSEPEPVPKGEELLSALERCSEAEDWSQMLHLLRQSGEITNQIFMNYANMALAHRGVLADSCFCYSPMGPGALIIGNAQTRAAYLVQSDVYYTLGFIAASQRCAFEAMTVAATLDPDVACLKRLVKTNLIFGHYRVARKYIEVLSACPGQAEWADHYRSMLNDEAVEHDKELGGKRRGLSKGEDRFSMFYGWEPELRDIIRSNPSDRTAVEYLGLSYLLQKDMERFGRFLDEYYDTEALPAGTLPISFQQGVIALYQQHREVWPKYQLSDAVVHSYTEYRDAYFRCQSLPRTQQAGRLYRKFHDTFWFYLMFIE